MATRLRNRSAARAVVVLLAAAGLGAGPLPGDDLTFRPSVIVRAGNGQGSGTIIASVPGEALVLTAAHVVRGAPRPGIELHRFNFGVERTGPAEGWPWTLPGEVAAADPVGDVAVVRVRLRRRLPFVARLAAVGDGPAPGAVVTSIGVDHGERLEGWETRVRSVAWFSMADAPGSDPGADRPFLITDRPPREGRSGGGLFLPNGSLVGVCVGRVEGDRRGHTRGVFAAPESVRRLLRDHDLDAAVVRSEARRRGEAP